MKRLISALILFALLSPIVAEAEDKNGNKVVSLLKDQPAPFSGLLVPEVRFKKYLELEMENEDLRYQLRLKDKLLTTQEAIYTEQLQQAQKKAEGHIWERPEFNRWLGFGLGVAITAFAIWGAGQLR